MCNSGHLLIFVDRKVIKDVGVSCNKLERMS